MERPLYSGYDNRNDSAMDLPLSLGLSLFSPSTLRSRAIPANNPGAPWSSQNTRNHHDASNSPWEAGQYTPAHTFEEFIPPGHHPQALEDNVATIESRLGLPIPNENTTNLCSSPTSLAPKRTSGDDNTIHCGLCGISFNGKWRRGNLNRHVKLKHTASMGPRYTCLADGCCSSFARSDARIKHTRRHHPELLSGSGYRMHRHELESSTPDTASTCHPDLSSSSRTMQDFTAGFNVSPSRRNEVAQATPLHASRVLYSEDHPQGLAGVKRTSTTDTHGSSASSLDFTVGQWLPSNFRCEEPTAFGARQQLHGEVTIKELPLAARIVFGSLYLKLNADDYSQLCDTYFDRWARLLNQLRARQSDTYALYAQIVRDLQSVVDAIDAGAVDLTNFGSVHYSGRPHPSQGSSSRGFEGASLGFGGTGAGSPPRRGSKPGGRKASKPNGPSNDAGVKKKSTKKSNRKGVSCPEFKHWTKRHDPSLPRPCNDCCVTVMSQLRNHINRHNGDSFVKHCKICEIDFVTQQAYDRHVAAQSCRHVPQLRSQIVTAWARLYIMKYPNANQIPNPYTDENGWLSSAKVAECRLWLHNITPSPFLGPQLGDNAPPGPSPEPIPVNAPDYNTGLSFALQDLVAHPHTGNTNPNAAALSRSVANLTASSPPTPVQRDQFSRQMQGATTQFFQAMARAPEFESPEVLAIRVDTAEELVRQFRMYVESQAQQNRTQALAQSYPTPRNQPSSRAGRSTQPSTQSRHTGSSRQTGSYNTRPSSVGDHADVAHQNPLQSNAYLRPTTSPPATYDRPRHQQNLSPYEQRVPSRQGALSQQAFQHQQSPLYQQPAPYQHASLHQQASLYPQAPSPRQQAGWLYPQVGSPHSQAGSLYSQEGLGHHQPWNIPQSPSNWPQDEQVFSPDATVNPSALSSPNPENGNEAVDRARRQFWRRW